MSQSKYLVSLIQAMTDPEFDEIIKIYLIDVDGITNAINCNGPYDSGLDLRTPSFSETEIQYQATTIKKSRFEAKLKADLKKAKENVIKYEIPNKIKYFYSQSIPNRTILELKKMARNEYDLILDIIESNSLSEIAIIYDSIKSRILELSDYEKFHGGSDFFESSKVKAFYDLMSIGSATDIKYNIIKSYIISYLNENGKTTIVKIRELVNQQFESNLTNEYFESILRRMNSQQQITLVDSYKIDLTETERQRLENVLEEYKLQEAIIRKNISTLLTNYQLGDMIEDIIIKLSELYESNYSVNLTEFTHRNSSIQDLKSSTRSFVLFLESNNLSKPEAENLANDLFELSDENPILSRIAAGHVFSKVSDPDRLQDYITQHHRNKDVFIDTNVLIYLLCAHYEPNAEYNKYQYKVAQQFITFVEKNGLSLKTTKQYALETTNLFKHALELIPFTKLPYFNALGKTNNILYDFYLHLSDWDILDYSINSFEKFLKEFRFEAKNHSEENNYSAQINYLLSSLGVEIVELERYDLRKARKSIEEALYNEQRSKSNFVIQNDSIMFSRLGDSNVNVNPIEPIFCTWDMILMKARVIHFQDSPDCTKWFMYTPTRLMDHFSMMNLKVKKGSLTNEVLTILEEDFNFQEKTQSLIDSVKTIINPKDEIGLKYTNKLAQLREENIVQINHHEIDLPDLSLKNSPVDTVFESLLKNYIFESQERDIDLLKLLFTKEELFDDVINVIRTEVDYVKKNKGISDNLFLEVDKLIDTIK